MQSSAAHIVERIFFIVFGLLIAKIAKKEKRGKRLVFTAYYLSLLLFLKMEWLEL